jgi:acetophenone carboxylase
MNAGGAGYGDPLLRDPEKVMEDLEKEIISDWVAVNIYKVVYDPETRSVDLEKTEEERKKEREDRKSRAKAYDEFEREWSKKKPAEQALIAFGTWPEGRQTRRIVRI